MAGKRELPGEFLSRMAELLGAEYEDFLASYENERYYGLRRNPLKASEETFLSAVPFMLEPVNWAKEGYYYQPDDQPGKHILHEAGAYYIQEPSAMAVVEILDPRPGEYILDLCAAPGGKSTQIAGRMQGEGLLVSNEIIQSRARILSQNVERMGIRNCVVCNETPDRMAFLFPSFFDRIVVDAPCSGEGMFRKDETAVAEWSVGHVAMCADRQLGILNQAAGMLKPGGVLVYSTCTFAPDENEGVISRFMKGQEGFVIEDIAHDNAFSIGRPDWIRDAGDGLTHTMRLWPHQLKGEGHYIARLRKQGNLYHNPDKKSEKRSARRKAEAELEERVQSFLIRELGFHQDWLRRCGGTLHSFGEHIYLLPDAMPSVSGIKVIRPGLHLGSDKKNRIEPSHALSHAFNIEETGKVMEVEEKEAERYLRGESLPCSLEKGWTIISYRGFGLGFGKAVNGQMKNHYPKGLRRY